MLRLAMIFALRLGRSTHFMMLNPARFASAASKSNVIILLLRKECCEPLWFCPHHNHSYKNLFAKEQATNTLSVHAIKV